MLQSLVLVYAACGIVVALVAALRGVHIEEDTLWERVLAYVVTGLVWPLTLKLIVVWLREIAAGKRGRMRRGDQLWYFDAPQEAWSNLAGQEGFAVVRKGLQQKRLRA